MENNWVRETKPGLLGKSIKRPEMNKDAAVLVTRVRGDIRLLPGQSHMVCHCS